MQRSNGGTNKTSLRSVYIMRECILTTLWARSSLWVPFFQHHTPFNVNNTSEKVSPVRTKQCTTRSLIWKVNLKFLHSSRHFNCDTVFAVIVSFLNEYVHGFNNVHKRRTNTRFQIKLFREVRMFLVKKRDCSICDIMVYWFVGCFGNFNLTLTFHIQLLP